jgi:hypothetical protein
MPLEWNSAAVCCGPREACGSREGRARNAERPGLPSAHAEHVVTEWWVETTYQGRSAFRIVRDAMLQFFIKALTPGERSARLLSLRRMWTRSAQRARAQGVSGWWCDLRAGLRQLLGAAWPALLVLFAEGPPMCPRAAAPQHVRVPPEECEPCMRMRVRDPWSPCYGDPCRAQIGARTRSGPTSSIYERSSNDA